MGIALRVARGLYSYLVRKGILGQAALQLMTRLGKPKPAGPNSSKSSMYCVVQVTVLRHSRQGLSYKSGKRSTDSLRGIAEKCGRTESSRPASRYPRRFSFFNVHDMVGKVKEGFVMYAIRPTSLRRLWPIEQTFGHEPQAAFEEARTVFRLLRVLRGDSIFASRRGTSWKSDRERRQTLGMLKRFAFVNMKEMKLFAIRKESCGGVPGRTILIIVFWQRR